MYNHFNTQIFLRLVVQNVSILAELMSFTQIFLR